MITIKYKAWIEKDKKMISFDIEVTSEGIGHRADDGSLYSEMPEDAILVPYCLLER